MHRKSLSELPDKEFLEHVDSIYNQCSQHSMAWNIDSTRISSLYSFLTTAKSAYEDNANPSTRNHVTAIVKKRAFADLKHDLSVYVDYLELNEDVPDDALEYMHLRPRTHSRPQPIPAPAEAPLLTVKQQYNEITAYVTRQEYGQPAHGVQLKPYHGFRLHWRFEEEKDWHAEISLRLHHTLHFENSDRGRTVIMADGSTHALRKAPDRLKEQKQ